MLRLITFAVLSLCSFSTVYSQVATQLRTGTFLNTEPLLKPSNDPAFFSPCLYQGKYYLWLQFNELPGEADKTRLTATGVSLYDYLPKNTFVASFPSAYNFEQLNSYKVYAVTRPLPHYKIDPLIYQPNDIPWAVLNDSMRQVTVSFTRAFTKNEVAAALVASEVSFTREADDASDALRIMISESNLIRLASHPLVQYIEPIGAPPVLEDEQGVTGHRNNMLLAGDNYAGGRRLDGSNVVVVLGDDGYVGEHIDFTGRIGINTTGSSGTHGDHVAGIILGANNFNPIIRGQAPGATLRVYSGYNDFYLYPALYTSNLTRISNHSLGQTCNSGYTTDARTSDQQVRIYPSLMHVHSCGNSGTTTCGGLSGGWATITGGFKAGKNVLAVANLGKSDIISSSSSKGPLPDGRLKPDISAVGSFVNSTQPGNTFASFSGTSMASPAVAGSLAVLYQAYKQLNGGTDPNSGLIKAIMMNTADDLGQPGPDFTYGWGRVNARRAVECIENGRFSQGTIAQGEMNTHDIVVPAGVETVKVMVYWVDIEATAGAAKSLVNDIDCWVEPQPGVINLPWKLNAGPVPTSFSCSAPATLGQDTLNNVEQVQLTNPAAGTYTLKVSGTSIPLGSQTYYVVYDFIYSNDIKVVHPFGGESFVPNEIQRIRWDATGSVGNFSVDYSTDEGANWTTLSSSISGSQRYYDWTVPIATTSKALVRVSRGGFFDNSDTNFTILPVPTNVAFSDECAGATKITWSPVLNAAGYDVFVLGTKFMELVTSTTATEAIVSGLGSATNWFAVRATLGVTGNGRRTIAKSYANTSTTTCTMPVKLLSFKATKQREHAELLWVTATELGIMKYVVERSSSASFDRIVTVGEVASRNSNAVQEYRITDKNIPYGGTWYYRLRIVEVDKTIYSKLEVLQWDKKMDITIYPNPASSTLSIWLGRQYTTAPQAEIINETGTKVLSFRLPLVSNAVNIRKLPAGSYILVVKDAKEGIKSRKQFNIIR